jgi:hypothetical protein
MTSLVLVVLLLASPTRAGTAQQQATPQSEAPALIFGYVVRTGTGEAVPGARVTLTRAQGRGQALAAVSDANGRFVIGNIAAGDYRLEVEREGYVDHEYGQASPNRPGTVLVLLPGQRLDDLVVSMVPTGAITGRVFDQNGQALEGVDVRAMRFRYEDGVRVLENARTAETNDLGVYRLYWLEPGEYFVSATFNSNRQQLLRLAEALTNAVPEGIQAARGGANPLELFLPQIEQARTQQTAEIYVDTYFPGTYDAARASSVTVLAASEMTAINFTVLPTRAVTVSGRVAGPFSESDGLSTSVTLVPRNSMVATTGGGRGRGRGSGGRGQDGSFSISGVAPGSYTLVATMESRGRGGRGNRGGRDLELSGFANIEVGNQDVQNVVVQVQPAVTIRGQIWVDEAAAGIDLDDLRMRLEPPRDIPLGSPNARIEDDGSFVLEEVSQTLYRASLTGLPQDYYVVDARAGAYDALSGGIQVTSGLAPLQFWISGSGATLDGAVQIASDQAFSGAQVVLVPQDARRQDLYKVVSADQYGRFSMQGIAPGRYSVFAWEDLPSGAYLDPVFINQYRNRGFAVDIQQGGQAQAQPRLIQAGR